MPASTSTVQSDRVLVEQMARGDERALARAYDRFGTLVYSIAYHILGDAADSEEVAVEVFMQAWTSAGSFDPARANVAAWLAMIARSRALDHVRARKRRTRLVEQIIAVEQLPSEPDSPAAQADASDLRDQVVRVLAELPVEQRRAVELAFFAGLTHSEIAEQLNEPLGTIKTRIRSALGKLRGALGAYQ